MANELEIISKAIDIEEFTHLDLAKLAGFNEKELKMVEIFWDAAYNESWIYLSSEIIHDYLGYKKTSTSLRDFYSTMKAKFADNIEYKEVNKDHEIVKFHLGRNTDGNSKPGNRAKYYIVTGETLKMMAMMANTVKGQETRNYFLKVEGLCRLMSKYLIEKVKQEFAKQSEEFTKQSEGFAKQSEEAALQLFKKDEELANQVELLRISESKNLNLTSSILNEKIFKLNGFVYFATCDQYARDNHYRFGKTNDLKKRLSAYQVGRTDKDLMYYAFVFESENVEVLELLLRRWMKDFRQNPKKDIYVLPWPVLSEFTKNICDHFHNGMVPSVNKMIRENLLLAADEGIIPPVTNISVYDKNKDDIDSEDNDDSEESEEDDSGDDSEEEENGDDSEEEGNNRCSLVIIKKPHPIIKTKRINPLQCLRCAKILNNYYNYDKHINAIRRCDEILQCGLCNMQFPHMYKFERHRNRATSCI